MNWFASIHPIWQTLLATLFAWFVTSLGSAVVFLRKEINRKILDTCLGFSAGIMISASFLSLIIPSIEISHSLNIANWLPVSVGFICGGLFLIILNRIVPHLHLFMPQEESEGSKKRLSRKMLIILAIGIHNLPEGLAIGVAFESITLSKEATLAGALALTTGIAIQNFPEGMAVSLPFVQEGYSRFKSFWYGQISAAVEPFAGFVGALFLLLFRPLMPYALAFAAGAMVFVVIEDLIPEVQFGENAEFASVGVIIGCTLMIFLDALLCG